MTQDPMEYLITHGCSHTAAHCRRVAAQAVRLAGVHGIDPLKAETAALLHDISAVIPTPERVAAARRHGLDLLPEELALPMIIHQKLSVVLAREAFGVTDEEILGAIGCHTTLRRGATTLDKLLFVSDKLSWDQADQPPYFAEVEKAATASLDEAVRLILVYARGSNLKVVHPWLRDAYADLCGAPWDPIRAD